MDNCCIIVCIINTASTLSLESVGIVWLEWQTAGRKYTSGPFKQLFYFSPHIFKPKLNLFSLFSTHTLSQQIIDIYSTNILYILDKYLLYSHQILSTIVWLVWQTAAGRKYTRGGLFRPQGKCICFIKGKIQKILNGKERLNIWLTSRDIVNLAVWWIWHWEDPRGKSIGTGSIYLWPA